jgi:ADP-ribosyl-[dinitrogen reductase] hydrolase
MDDKKLGTLIGLAIGDAMGAPYEFMNKNVYIPTKEYAIGGCHNVDLGEYTDDTSMALCLANSLIECKEFDAYNQMEKYSQWYKNGYMSTRKYCFDIGNATRKSIDDFIINNIAYSKVTRDYESGNGSIMRLAPIPMYYDDYEEMIKYAYLSSRVTHKSDESANSCVILTTIIYNCYKFNDKDLILSNYFDDFSLIEKAKANTDTIPTGYCRDTLEIAIRGFYNFDTFIDGLMYVISLGEDTDTVGAVYGQIAGAYYGLSQIPNYYKQNLMNYNLIFDIANKLIVK